MSGMEIDARHGPSETDLPSQRDSNAAIVDLVHIDSSENETKRSTESSDETIMPKTVSRSSPKKQIMEKVVLGPTESALPLSQINEVSFVPPQPYRYEKLCQIQPRLMDHPSITFGGPMIIIFDIVLPCVIYYTWYNTSIAQWKLDCQQDNDPSRTCLTPKPNFDKNVLGYAVISFGVGELYILLARIYRLWTAHADCAPLLSHSRWVLDATSWVYAMVMICALIPFVVGSSMVMPHLYLYGPAFIMGLLGILMIGTLLPITIPININSHPRGSRIRPFIYYAAEDFIAVDGLQDRNFRTRYNTRYENSPAFRRLFLLLTIWWITGIVVYMTCLSAVVWTVEFHHAFGLSLGILFLYIATWAFTSYIFVSVENEMEYERAKEAGILGDGYA